MTTTDTAAQATTTEGAEAAATGPSLATAASRQALGTYGERVAARHLVEKGMRLLERNWRSPGDPVGEIDLVLREGDVLVVCEVKTRTSLAAGTPHEAISDDKLQRLQRLGWRWAVERGVHPPEIRVDLIAVMRPARGAAVVDHVPGVG